jgi:hypothetical protein
MAENFAFELIVSGEFLALVYLAVQADKPSDESAAGVTVRRLVVVDELALVPGSEDAPEFRLEVGFGLRVGLLAGQRAIEVVDRAEVVAVLAGDDGQLVVCMARVGVDVGGEVVVALCGAPVALLVLVDELRLAVARQVAEVDEGLVTGVKNLGPMGGRDTGIRACLGSWRD